MLTRHATHQLLATWNSTTVAEGAVLIAGAKITDLLADIDAVLATNDYFLLSKWIGEAKSWSADVDEVAFLEYQARNQLSECMISPGVAIC